MPNDQTRWTPLITLPQYPGVYFTPPTLTHSVAPLVSALNHGFPPAKVADPMDALTLEELCSSLAASCGGTS